MQRPSIGFGVGFKSSSGRPLVVGNVAEAKKEKWMQDVKIKRKGICTGDKYGGPTCPPGSRQYALAKTFRKTAKKGGKSKK